MPIDLEQIIQEKGNIPGTIEKIDIFETWFNPYCATVINKLLQHTLRIIVYEPPYRKVEEKLLNWKVSESLSLREIKEKKKEIKQKLNSKRPMARLFFAYSIPFLKDEIAIIRVDDINNPDKYIRLFDIVKRDISPLAFHVAVYLGDKKVCHIYSHDNNAQRELEVSLVEEKNNRENSSFFSSFFNSSRSSTRSSSSSSSRSSSSKSSSSSSSQSSQTSSSSGSQNRQEDYTNEDLWVKIDDWETFLDGNQRKVICYHPIIPSKKPELILENLKRALRGDYDKGKYSLLNNNCEHFANLIVHGVNYSEQVWSHTLAGSVFTLPLHLKENKKIEQSLETKADKQIFNNLEIKRELTSEEQQVFQRLESQILQSTAIHSRRS